MCIVVMGASSINHPRGNLVNELTKMPTISGIASVRL
jgi:hypothetical protein